MSVPKLHLFAFNPDSIPVADRRPNGGYRFGAEAHVYFAASQIRQLTSVDPTQAPAAVDVLVQAVQAGENHCLATITTTTDCTDEWTCLCGDAGASGGGVYGAIVDHGQHRSEHVAAMLQTFTHPEQYPSNTQPLGLRNGLSPS